MKKFQTTALAGIFALSTSFGSIAHADSIGCTSDGSTAQKIAALEQVKAALEQWISNRTPADPNYLQITGNLTNVQGKLDLMYGGYTPDGSKPLFSPYFCGIDVSPA